MKTLSIVAAAAFIASSTVAHAGGLAPTVSEPVEVVAVAPPASSIGQYIIPAILLALIAVAATAESDAATTSETD